MIKFIVHNLLATNAAIANAVGEQVCIVERPQRMPLPAVVVSSSSAVQDHHLKGTTQLVTGFVTITTLATSQAGAADLMKLVHSALKFTGVVTITDADGQDQTVKVKSLLQQEDTDIPSDHRDGQGSTLTHGVETTYRYAIIQPAN